ncbi:MAG: isoprenylcysteine carboxylmethyltransferase family protein [Acidobacteria bacterium]|nr:isoprenylcysteine carboxylmethyltransferase family protein [Acidobacteriota bacterium]
METLFIAVRSLIFMLGFVSLWAWIAVSVSRLDASLGILLPEWAPALGAVVMLAGAALALTCAGTFVVRGRGTPAPFDAPVKLVAAGPYRYVRNPMYIGGWLLLVGFGLFLSSSAMLLFALIWLVPAHLFVILYEEPTLRHKFGASYESYCRSVPRWGLTVLRRRRATAASD